MGERGKRETEVMRFQKRLTHLGNKKKVELVKHQVRLTGRSGRKKRNTTVPPESVCAQWYLSRVVDPNNCQIPFNEDKKTLVAPDVKWEKYRI